MSTQVETPIKTQEGMYAVIQIDNGDKSVRLRGGYQRDYTEVLATLYKPENVDQDTQDKLEDADGDLVALNLVYNILDDEDEDDIEATSDAIVEAEDELIETMLKDEFGKLLAQAQFVQVIFEDRNPETYVRTETCFELEEYV